MSGYHDSGRGGDRYAPPPRRDSSSLGQPPPSGPSRPYSRPSPLSSAGPPRHPSSSSYSRPYDSAPRGPRYSESAPLHPRAYEPPPPARRPALSLWSTQNPGGRDGYHHSGPSQNQGRSYPPATQYRELDREPYDRDRDYRATPQHSRFRDAPSQRDSYQPPSGPRDSYRDPPPRHASSSYHPSYSSPSPPTGPRGYASYQPPPSRQSQNQPEPRSRERTPSGPALWSNRASTVDRRSGYLDPPRGRDPSPVSSGPSRPRTPGSSGRREGRDEYRRTSPSSSYRRESPDRRRSDEYRDSQSVRKQSSNESIRSKQEEEPSRPQTADSKEGARQMTLSPKIPMVDEEDTLTHSDIESRIKGIDEKIESANQRIMEIDQQSQGIQQQLKAIRENVETTASQVPDTLASEVKSEAAADDTEEDAELTATPIEVDVEAEEKSLSYPAPPKREMRINVARKRARPVSEIEEERENARVRIWRLLKELPIKVEEVKLEYELEHDIVIPISTNELHTIEKVEDLSDHEESAALHQQIRHAMFRTLHLRKKRQHWRQAKLRRKYRQQYIVWQNHMDKLDAQRQSEMERLGLQPPKVEAPATPRIEGVTPSTPNTELLTLDLSGGTRGTRRAQQAAHARDYVQSEAEFLELMASLGTEEKDPTAEIPPMLPPDERNLIDFDETGIVHDPVTFYTRALFTVEEGTKFDVQGWLDEEDKAYMRRLSIAGKQFGRFKRAAPLQHRSVQELVQHYYFLKGDGEGLDWRSVIAGKNRYGKGAVGRPSAASVLIGSGAPSGKPRSAGRGRGRTRSNNPVPLLQPKSKDDDDDDSRSIIDDDADDSGSMTAGGVRTARAKKGRVIESTAAKQRPKRVAAPAAPKEKTVQAIAPSPAPSNLEERPPSREQSVFASSFGLPQFSQETTVVTDRESSVPPGDGRKRPQAKQPQTSSYWRVNEMEMFPKHLNTFGKDWHKIAEEMGTKTAQQVKNYYAKHAVSIGWAKKDDSESGQSRPGTSSTPHRLEMVANPMETQRSHVESSISVSLGSGGPQYDSMPHPSQPSPQPLQQALQQPLPQPTQSQKPLPTVASLLNSPEQETVRPRGRQTSNWPEALAPTPRVPAPAGALPLPIPDFEHESRRVQSPSNASDLSRSQSRGDSYQTEMGRTSSMYASQQGIQTGPLRDEQSGYYRDDPRSLPGSSRFMSSSQQNILPPVRIHEPLPGHQSPFYPGSRYDSMPPPQAMSQDPNYGRESYPPLSPVQHRSYSNVLSPLPPPALPSHVLPPSDSRNIYYPPRDQERRPPPEAPRDTRYPPLRDDGYYPRDGRDYYRYEEEPRYIRDRPFERDRMEIHPIQTERQRVDRERDRLLPREREEWPRERYTESYPPRQYPEPPPPRLRTPPRQYQEPPAPRPRSPPRQYPEPPAPRPRSPPYGSREYGWERIDRERMERERERMDYDRERWQRR